MTLGITENALYDSTLTRASGAGLLFNQVVRRMSHAVVSVSADAVLSVLRRLCLGLFPAVIIRLLLLLFGLSTVSILSLIHL